MTKELVAAELARRVKSGETIGVGTGSTVEIAVKLIGERVKKEGLRVLAVPTSLQTAWQCEQLGIQVTYAGYCGDIAWGFDGADAVHPEHLWLIKGKGGALLQEKILAARCRQFVVIVDESKFLSNFADCAIPVEVVPEARSVAERGLKKLGAVDIVTRTGSGKHGPIITEAGNVILDAKFSSISSELERELKAIVGVVESGLFIDYASEVLVADAQGVRRVTR